MKNKSYEKILIGVILGICYIITILPSKSGNIPCIRPTIYPIMYNGMLIIPINKNIAFHIHHWIIYMFIFLLFNKILGLLISGFILTLTLHGFFWYKDSLHIITNNPWK